ncbi:putative Ig domain-containing protein, partial [Sphingobacterium alkalisoli]|uniref:putative Ig domain-containing protein n=1 Tax=Sphingobacterium alkalisoli TaxID=1874115 RepID=UPI0016664AC1
MQPLSTGAPVISYGAARTFAVNEQISWSPTNSGDAATFSVTVEQTLLSGYYNPLNTASAADGSLYITNTGYHSILKRTAAGVQTVFAGGNSTVYGYVNGTGTAARFRHPSFLAIDASGNIFVADQQNHRIRKITPSGVVTTFAGSGSIGSANGTGTAASFHYPMGLAFDGSGNLYVADAYNNKIRKITPSGVVSDYAGSGVQGQQDGTVLTARFYQPKSLYFDSNGDLYVADRLNNILRKVSGGNVTTVAGNGTTGFVDGQGSAARFNGFSDFVIRRGNIYSVDMLNNALRYISPSGNVITISTSGQITNPFSISEDAAGKLYIAENTSHRIKKVSVQQAYSISPALPIGLTFDHSTGKISGKLSAVTVSQSYTVTARNTSGTATSILTFSVGGSSGGANFGSSDQNYILET